LIDVPLEFVSTLSGDEQLLRCFDSSSIEVQSLAAAVLANFASFRRAYIAVQKHKGISVLVRIENTFF